MKIKFCTPPRLLVLFYMLLILSIFFFWCTVASPAADLEVRSIEPSLPEASKPEKPDQLPHSRVARGNSNISIAWLAGPTARYRHGVLGDSLEARRLIVETRSGKRLQFNLPRRRVFEDLEPRLSDINGDRRDEILVVESDMELGASLSVYGIVNGQLRRIAATSFLGQPYRWLNPLGVGDFDGDGKLDIAIVVTPHIGGKLQLFRYNDSTLSLFAEYPGISTHRMGSTELGLGRVLSARPRDQLLVPNQNHRVLMLLEWTPDRWKLIARTELPGQLESALTPTGDGRWRFQLEDGRHFEVKIDRQQKEQ